MNSKLISLVITTGLLAAGTCAADHNSKNGEGTANMPNDIHNTRVETRESNDNEAFRDFVKYGEGSKTVNRFESEATQPGKATEQKGNAKAAKNGGESKATKQNKVKAQASTQDRSRTETRTRSQPSATGRLQSTRSAASTRSRGGSKAGGKR